MSENLNNLSIDKNHKDVISLRKMLGKNTGYLRVFTKWVFVDGHSIDTIASIIPNIKELDRPIDSFYSPEEVFNYIHIKMLNRKFNKIIKSIPSKSRVLVDDNIENLIKLNIDCGSSLSNFYSKKGGRYKNSSDLYNDTLSLIKTIKGEWILSSIPYNSDELVYKDYTILILCISSFERCNILGSQHWCISTNQTYWDHYSMEFSKQYIIYDFSKEISDKRSMIGVTIDNKGEVDSAHYRDDSDAMGLWYDSLGDMDWRCILRPYPKSVILNSIDVDDIGVLSEYGFKEEVEELLYKGSYPDASAIYKSILSHSYDILRLFTDIPNIDLSCDNNKFIWTATAISDIQSIKILLSNPDVDPKRGFEVAFPNYDLEIIKLYLRHNRLSNEVILERINRPPKNKKHLRNIKKILNDDGVIEILKERGINNMWIQN